jgi:hypothetical protein
MSDWTTLEFPDTDIQVARPDCSRELEAPRCAVWGGLFFLVPLCWIGIIWAISVGLLVSIASSLNPGSAIWPLR